MSVFIHPLSDCQSKDVGEGTRIWQYCVVLPGAKIGKNCNICSHCFIENDVVIGDNVTIKCGVQIWDGMRIEDNVFIGPNATFCNDRHPVSGNSENFKLEPVIIRKGAMIGAGAVVLPGVTIGECATIGAGAIVTKDVSAASVVVGAAAIADNFLVRDEI
jgi:acetyltransferase-like isoleucine patch superfamily enzyme